MSVLVGSGGDVRNRLQGAALELFRERGYERTTAAEIAARAGVTERTFFRYFPDKREVLFGGEARVRAALVASIADAPVGLAPLDTLFRAFRSLQAEHEENQSYLLLRNELISTAPALHEREMAKMSSLAEALAAALKVRGVSDLRAELAARAGIAVFVHATVSWLYSPEGGFIDRIDRAFREMKAAFAEADLGRPRTRIKS